MQRAVGLGGKKVNFWILAENSKGWKGRERRWEPAPKKQRKTESEEEKTKSSKRKKMLMMRRDKRREWPLLYPDGLMKRGNKKTRTCPVSEGRLNKGFMIQASWNKEQFPSTCKDEPETWGMYQVPDWRIEPSLPGSGYRCFLES